jgi:hypothetical protein
MVIIATGSLWWITDSVLQTTFTILSNLM